MDITRAEIAQLTVTANQLRKAQLRRDKKSAQSLDAKYKSQFTRLYLKAYYPELLENASVDAYQRGKTLEEHVLEGNDTDSDDYTEYEQRASDAKEAAAELYSNAAKSQNFESTFSAEVCQHLPVESSESSESSESYGSLILAGLYYMFIGIFIDVYRSFTAKKDAPKTAHPTAKDTQLLAETTPQADAETHPTQETAHPTAEHAQLLAETTLQADAETHPTQNQELFLEVIPDRSSLQQPKQVRFANEKTSTPETTVIIEIDDSPTWEYLTTILDKSIQQIDKPHQQHAILDDLGETLNDILLKQQENPASPDIANKIQTSTLKLSEQCETHTFLNPIRERLDEVSALFSDTRSLRL